ncbi:hypothetical protein DSO57_1002973 [Entomophthora muscae]|uniref:Uncharacterized protein n=1 Tax=Entomophthora muscae TaxID=34485 RepID=A0ACC2U6E5_9FUNG|nr:hypothetical protein DSO57_1002973 [Entomophthora muscae]
MKCTYSIAALALALVTGSAIPADASGCSKVACPIPSRPKYAAVKQPTPTSAVPSDAVENSYASKSVEEPIKESYAPTSSNEEAIEKAPSEAYEALVKEYVPGEQEDEPYEDAQEAFPDETYNTPEGTLPEPTDQDDHETFEDAVERFPDEPLDETQESFKEHGNGALEDYVPEELFQAEEEILAKSKSHRRKKSFKEKSHHSQRKSKHHSKRSRTHIVVKE